MADFVEITVQIPEDRVADLYAYVASLHTHITQSVVPNNLLKGWKKDDKAEAQEVLSTCSPNAQRVLTYLADRPDQQVLGATIAADLGFSKGHMAIAGILGPLGKNCKKVNRKMPYDSDYDVGATAAFYKMAPEIATLFRVVP